MFYICVQINASESESESESESKKDDRQQIKNYRPVSLFSNISKIMERIVHDALYSYCTGYKLLTDTNSGFKATRLKMH